MPTKTILIVEDDNFLLRMYTTKLQMEGYKVIAALDGEKGIKMAKKDLPDLIILDLLLPKKSGFEVLDELKQDEATKEIPVIVLTNLSQKSDIDRCFKSGVRDFLIKAHFIPTEVISKISKILEDY